MSSTIAGVFESYAETLTPGSKEANSIETEAVHGRHFKRVLGAERQFDDLAVDVLQRYVDQRTAEGLVRETIRKELTTLRVLWGWAHKRKHVLTPAAWRMGDLTLPKAHEQPPFQTWNQIGRKIDRGSLTPAHGAELWECLWLDQA